MQQFYAGPEAESDPDNSQLIPHPYATTTPAAAQYYNNQGSDHIHHFEDIGIKDDEELDLTSNPEDENNQL